MNISQDTRKLPIELDVVATVVYSYMGERNGVSIKYPVDLLGSHKPTLLEKEEAVQTVSRALNAFAYFEFSTEEVVCGGHCDPMCADCNRRADEAASDRYL